MLQVPILKTEDSRYSMVSELTASDFQISKGQERLEKAYFFMQGISALLPWSSVLCTLDFYSAKFPDDDVSFTFPVAFFVSSVIFNFIMVYIKRRLSLNQRVIGGLVTLMIFLIILPLTAHNLSETKAGLWLCYVILFILGAANTVPNATVAGLAGFFPSFCRSLHSTGAGIAALITNLIRSCIVATSPADNSATDIGGILVFYGVAVFLLVLGIILHVVFMRSDQMRPAVERSMEEIDSVNTHNIHYQWKVFKETAALILAMFISNIQTFMLYPGVLFQKPLDFTTFTWTVIIICTIFNAMDTCGKYISYMKFFSKKEVTLTLVALRFLFYILFLWPVIDVHVSLLSEPWFFLLMVAIFGFLNGVVISSVFVMAPTAVKGEKKEVAGFLAFNAMMTGIMVGTFLALPFSALS